MNRTIDISDFMRMPCSQCSNYALLVYVLDENGQLEIYDVRCKEHLIPEE